MTAAQSISIAPRQSELFQALSHEIHVWLLPLPACLPARSDLLLRADEKRRWRRYRNPDHRRRFLIGKTLQRLVLSTYLQVAPKVWRFAASIHGRPEVAEPDLGRRLRFSLSHTHGLCALAVTLDGEIGVDVECADRSASETLVRFALSPAERAQRSQHLAATGRDPFLEYWTLKESYLKACGTGLSRPLAGIEFTLIGSTDAQLHADVKPSQPGKWQFARVAPSAHHRLAVAAIQSANPLPIVIRDATGVLSRQKVGCGS